MDKPIHVNLRFEIWVHNMRTMISKAENERALGVVEVAKALLLHGFKLHDDVQLMAVSADTKAMVIEQMVQRSALVLQDCVKHAYDTTPWRGR